jgi:glycosyltransferase involved in cell wall biosynthesis
MSTTLKKLKVFHILSNPSIGGIEQMLSELIPIIDSPTCKAQVVNMRTESKAYQLWEQKKVKYHRLKTPGKLPVCSIYSLAKLLRKEKPDIVVIYGLRANFIGRLAAKLAGTKVILSAILSTDDWRKWYHSVLDRITAWAVTGWVPNSIACMNSTIKREKFPKERFTVIYDGIDVEKWKRHNDGTRKQIRKGLGLSDDVILCVTVGNFRYQKGYPYLIQAIPEIIKKQPQARFVFVGRGKMEEELKKKCIDLGIQDYVIFTGYREDIRQIYEGADIMVLPSVCEGLPVSLIEAMSMELPVVSTKIGGIPELVENGITGILVPPADSDALTKAIVQLASDSAQRKQMGNNARKRVCENFSMRKNASKLIEYYQKQYNLSTERKV